MTNNSIKYRIESIDLLRGIVMVIMVLDHVRKFFHHGSFFIDPTDLTTTTPLIFFTRWITHFCAPVFVFLAGTSAFLYGSRRNNTKDVAWFLFSRGLFLIFLEMTIINFGWTFDIRLTFHLLQVIWAIGLSMVFLSAVVFLPKYLIFSIGLIIVTGHNLLDPIVVSGASLRSVLWYTFHQKGSILLSSDSLIHFSYPILPWIGLIFLGYVFGILYKKGFSAEKRGKYLIIIGSISVLLFIIIRTLNLYGDLNNWETQDTFIFSILSFLKTTKYPPSLLFILMTIGPSLIFLYFIENVNNKITKYLAVIGKVPLFFYVLHVFLIHLLGIIGVVLAGGIWTDMILTGNSFMTKSLISYGYDLYIVYPIWILVVVVLFPICKRYNEYKMNNRSKWWLSYL
ncbi:DUF1624 domain-containing protein [Candidatus Neomarinimicrobiota bacterium]